MNRIGNLNLRVLLPALILCVSVTVSSVASDTPPNIVFIFVDDQGYYDLGCYGATEVSTPHIDAMAQNGTRFTNYYAAAPICSPSARDCLPDAILAGLVTTFGCTEPIHTWAFILTS